MQKSNNYFNQLLDRLKNKKLVAFILVFMVTIIGLNKFTNALTGLYENVMEIISKEEGQRKEPTAFERDTIKQDEQTQVDAEKSDSTVSPISESNKNILEPGSKPQEKGNQATKSLKDSFNIFIGVNHQYKGARIILNGDTTGKSAPCSLKVTQGISEIKLVYDHRAGYQLIATQSVFFDETQKKYFFENSCFKFIK